MTVEFGVLGAIEARVDGRPVALGHARQQCVLVALLIDANQVVPTERLADRVWGDHPPQRARNALYSYLSRLRQILVDADGVHITRQRGGYILRIDPTSVDLHRFGQLLARARASGDDEHAHTLFERALGLWRGDAFAALDTAWLNSVRGILHQQRFAAELDYADIQLRLGQHAALLAELSGRAHAHPLDERLSGQLMLALYRCGRTGDALAQYQVSRRQLAADLGIDPGQELQRLHRQILTGDSLVHRPASPARRTGEAGPAGTPVPRQLPAPPPLFTGRASELSLLTRALPAPGEPGCTMAIWAIDGTGGVGKTWLALRWAHDNVRSFPDGQLHINLRGFGPSGSAVDPAQAVRAFLDAFGVAAERIPAGLDAQIGLYRSTLAGKRVLVVLDNARDVEQVRPLLPGSAGCVVVVTSRNRLTGLVATEGARTLSLDLLTDGEAHDLLAGRLGADRVAAEPHAVSEIIARCARLPLALAIAAAHGAPSTELPLARLAGELRDAAGRLDAFAAGDAATDVRKVFSWSYRALSTDAARLFRLLGLHPGPDIALPAATSLAGLPRRQVRELLTDLARAHLLTEHIPGRYTIHDLLRAYATEQASTHDSYQARRAAVHRVLDHYLHTARNAALLLVPQRDQVALAAPQPGVIAERLASHDMALGWFAAEYRVAIGAVEQAAAAGFDTHAWQLAWACTTFLLRRGYWHELVAVQHTALDAARRLGDGAGQSHVLRGLAKAYLQLGRLDEAETHYRQVLEVSAHLGDAAGHAHAYQGLVTVAERRGDLAEARGYAQQALDRYRAAGHRVGQASALNAVGWFHAQLGDYHQAVVHCEQALTLFQDLGYREGEGGTWDSLGYAHRGLADYEQAIICYQHALGLYRELGDRYGEADAFACLGDTHHAAGHPDAARTTWDQALSILDQLGHADAGRVRGMLDSLEPATGSAAPGPGESQPEAGRKPA